MPDLSKNSRRCSPESSTDDALGTGKQRSALDYGSPLKAGIGETWITITDEDLQGVSVAYN